MSGFKNGAAADDAIGFVVGLQAEAALLRGLNVRVAVGGGGFAGAERAAQELAASGIRKIVSFGLAGGLDPALPPGTVLVPNTVIADGETFACDKALVAWLGGTDGEQPILGAENIVASRAAKAQAFAETRASAVDLETGAVLRVAQRVGIGFAVLRAVCDPAARDLPPAALIALDSTGRIGGLRIALSLLQAPGQIPSLIALARDAARARAALQRRVRQLIHTPYGA